jgi:hypothetical protein
MTRRVYNIVVDESGKPIEGVEVHVSLNRTTYKGTIEVAKYGVLAKTDKRGYWEISLYANDTLDDPNSFYTVEEIKNGKRIATHYIRVPSSETYTEPIHIKQIEITPLPTTPPPNVVTGIAADNNIFLRGDVRLLSGSGIQLQQDNGAKTITIINTGGGGGGGGSSPHNLLDGSVHPDTEAVNVQRGMLIVGKLTGTGVKWSGLPIGLSGRFLKSTGIDVVWSNIDWTDIQNRPSTFPPSPHTHDAADIISGRLSTSRLPTSPNANRFLVVRTANSDPIYDTIQSSDLPATIDSNARVVIQNNGTLVGVRRAINFIAGAGIGLSISDDAANERVNVTITNTGGGGGGGVGSHNLLDGSVHPDTVSTTVSRGMLIVGRQQADASIKWQGLALGASGTVLKSNGTDALWGRVDWTEVDNKPATFPPSPHTHSAADITTGRLSASRLPTSATANRFLVVRTANADPIYDVIQASDLPAHTHTRSQITDFAHASTHQAGGSDPIVGNLDANARVTVKQSGTVVGTRRAINFIAGSNISLSIVDDAANEQVNITITNTGGGGIDGGVPSVHNLLDGVVHPDTEATTVQRGMLIVGRLSGTVVKWGGLPLGAAGRFLKSNGTDAVWDVIQVSDLPSHTHTKSQITDLEQITVTPTANAIPKADASGKIAVGWIPQGSGSNLDADKLDGLDSTAFERVSNKGVANGYAPLDANAKVPVTHIADNLRVATIGLTVGDGVNAITTGFKGAIPVPFSGTITEWTIVSTDANPPTSGSIQIDILKSTFANYPTMSSMVGTGTKPNIANSNKGTGTPTGWSTTTINAGDIIGFNVTSVTGLKRITIVLKVVKS